jgi:hypothetical protein
VVVRRAVPLHYSLTHSLTPLLEHECTRKVPHSTHSLTHPLHHVGIHPLPHLPTPSQSLPHSLTHSLAHSPHGEGGQGEREGSEGAAVLLPHSLTHSLARQTQSLHTTTTRRRSLTHSLTHSLIRLLPDAPTDPLNLVPVLHSLTHSLNYSFTCRNRCVCE